MITGPLTFSDAITSLSRCIWMFALTCLLVISSTAIQTHLHRTSYTPTFHVGTALSDAGQNSGDTDADHCLLCQAFLAGGGFIPVVGAVLHALDFHILAAQFAPTGTVGAIVPVGWQGRAPPR